MKKNILNSILDLFPIILIFGISSVVANIQQRNLDFDDSIVYEFTASYKVEILVSCLSILLIIAIAFLFSFFPKKRASVVFMIAFLFLFKVVIIITGFMNCTISDKLWMVYLSPICAISDYLDIFCWLFYDFLILLPFFVGVLIKKEKS